MNTPTPSTIMFVLRFWLARSAAGARWRGSIEHIPSGERGMFLRAEELLRFLRKFEILLDDAHRYQSAPLKKGGP